MENVILVTGASSGFGVLASRGLAASGHIVYAAMRDTAWRNASQATAAREYAAANYADLRVLDMDVVSDASVDSAVRRVVAESGRIDVVVHNAGHMVFGPAEAFTPVQLAELYDVNVLSTQRVNRAALPHLRRQGRGLLVWVSSSTPPAAPRRTSPRTSPPRPGWTRWRWYTPGSWRGGASRRRSSSPAPLPAAPTTSPTPAPRGQSQGRGIRDRPLRRLRRAGPQGLRVDRAAGCGASAVADAIVNVVNTPFGKRPFRVHVDPSQDGAEVVNAVSDRVRAEFLRRIGLSDLLKTARECRQFAERGLARPDCNGVDTRGCFKSYGPRTQVILRLRYSEGPPVLRARARGPSKYLRMTNLAITELAGKSHGFCARPCEAVPSEDGVLR